MASQSLPAETKLGCDVFQTAIDFIKLAPNLRKLHSAQQAIAEKRYDEALSILDHLDWKPLAIDTMILKAQALIGVEKNKEAAIILAEATQAVEKAKYNANRKKYLQIYCVALLEKASGDKILSRDMLNTYHTIDLEKVSGRIKRQFPMNL